MNKSQTKCEQVVNKLWTSYEQVMNNSGQLSLEQTMSKQQTNHEQVMNKCHKQAMSKS